MRGWSLALAWGGPVVVALGWIAVRARGVSIWVAMGATVGPLGLLAALTGEGALSGELGPPAAAGAGAGAGLGLYAATAAFMWVVRRWPALARHTGELYEQRRGLSLPLALAVAVLVVAPGEEALWRGLVQGLLEGPAGAAGAAALAWVAYVAVNTASGSIPIVLGGAAGGAAWGGVALWTGGWLASALCHMVWTGLMIAAPPVFREPSS